ncbi:MAG: hypothetical protein Q9195_009164 [Heterodermia aff. obscurata]
MARNEAAANRKAWTHKFRQGRARHRKSLMLEYLKREKNNLEMSLDPAVLKLTGISNLSDDDVINAIGSFWVALRRDDLVFGYGDAALFKNGRRGGLGLRARGVFPDSDKFIMPLLFTVDEHEAMEAIKKQHQIKQSAKTSSEDSKSRGVVKTRGSKSKKLKASSKHIDSSAPDSSCIGHFLLAISTREPDGSISTTLLDSSPGYVTPSEAAAAYRGLVTHSGWLGLNSDGTAAIQAPNFTAALTPTVPTQQGFNTCGLYVILNAWASMLEIPITANRQRRVRRSRSYKRFLSLALEIVNLALRGYMDSQTVQAFMIAYGYAEQDAEDVRAVDAARMESGTLAAEFDVQWGKDIVPYLS